MINLIPEDEKKLLWAARANLLLIRYLIITIIVVALIFLELTLAIKTISAEEAPDASTQGSSASFTTQQNAESFRSDLETAKSVLRNRSNDYMILTDITSVLPSNAVISNISIDSTTSVNVEISVAASDEQTLSELLNTFKNISFENGSSVLSVTDSGIFSDNGSGASHPFVDTFNIVIGPGSAG